mgnify:CR=1 FL=1
MKQSIKRSELIEIIKEILREMMNEASVTGNIAGYETPNAFSGGLAKNKKMKKDLIKKLHMKLVGKIDESKDDVELMKVYTMKDRPPFKVTESKSDGRDKMDSYGGGSSDSKGNNTSLFKDAKTGRYYLYIKTKKQQGYFDMPKNIKSRSQADSYHMKVQDMIKAGKKLKLMKESRYHEYRNDETRTPKQKIWHNVKEVRDSLVKLERSLKHAIKLKTEQGMDSRTYYKYAKNSFPKIQEKLIKMAKKVGELSA